MNCYVITKEVFEDDVLKSYSIVAIMNQKDTALDVYNNFDKVLPGEIECEEGQEVKMNMYQMKMDTVYAEKKENCQGELEKLVNDGILESYIGEDGEFYFEFTEKGKKLMEE